MLESQEDTQVLGRSLLECAIIRFHQQRRYALDVVRILLELDSAEDTIGIAGGSNDKQNGSEDEGFSLEPIQVYVAERIFTSPTKQGDGRQRMLSHFLPAMTDIKSWLQKLGDKIAAAQTLGQTGPGGLTEEAETIEFSRVSLIQQHELLGVIMCELVTKRQATVKDFEGFMEYLRKLDRYDHLLGQSSP
jgi:nuclear pore complex protein Nup205